MKKIIFTGGGTAGHIIPIIAVCREIKKICANGFPVEFYYLGPKDNFGKALLAKEGIKIKIILSGKIRRYLGMANFFQNLFDIIFKIPLGILQAFLTLFWLSPDLIFSKGGYGSIPTVISGWTLMTPIFLHESDFIPGLANRFISRFASKIFISFPHTNLPSHKTIFVGNPVREEILTGSKGEAKRLFKISGEKPVILILGGSQGAQRINENILTVLPDLLKSFEILHQCGEKNFKAIGAEAGVVISKDLEKYYHLFSFLGEEELKQAYATADLIISRAGAGTIFEILALGKPSILVPLPEAAQNHQLKNAYFFAQNGATMVIEEINFTPHFILGKLKDLFASPQQLRIIAERAKSLSQPEAAKIIAQQMVEYLTR